MIRHRLAMRQGLWACPTSRPKDAPFADMVIADPDVGHINILTVTLSNPAGETLSSDDVGSYDAATGTYTISGSPAATTAALDGLVFTPAAAPR
jgi:hypothetical protein